MAASLPATAVAIITTSTDISNITPSCIACHSLLSTFLFSFVFGLIVFIGVCGNAFVVAVIVTDKKLLNSPVNQFLLNLAIADIGHLLFCLPDMSMVMIDHGWVLPRFSCRIIRFFQEYFLYSSVLLQMSIGIERFLAICSPLRMQRFSHRTTIIVAVVVWAVALAFATPYFLFQGIYNRIGIPFCVWIGISKDYKTIFKWAEFIVLFLFPLILLTVLYTIMGRVLWGKTDADVADETQQAAILKLRRTVVKMLIISMLLYFLCYTPIQGIFIWESIYLTPVKMDVWLRLSLNAFSVSSSSANPVVYIMCCRHFHSRFVKLLRFFVGLCGRRRAEKYSCVAERDVSCSVAKLSRSPYVSFRKIISSENSLCAVDWVFCQQHDQQKDIGYSKQTLQIYEVLLESWKDPLGVEEFFHRQEENGQNLTFFWEPSVQLMVFLNKEKQALPVGARQAVDTVLSLFVNESFLKKNIDERRLQVVQVVDSFALLPEEKAPLDEFSEAVRVKARSLYGPEIFKDLIKQF